VIELLVTHHVTQGGYSIGGVTPRKQAQRRRRGSIDPLPSGALRVRVYAGKDPLTGRRHDLVEIIPAGSKAAAQAEAVRTRLLNQVDERRNPRTSATVDQLLDRHFELATLEPTTRSTYIGYANKHIRPLIGAVKVGVLDADVFDSFYAELRRCREHCDRRPFTQHRTTVEHECDERCRPHVCTPLGASTIRQVHFILSGALKRAVRWRWIATSPITQAEPPAAPKPDPRPPTAAEAARILNEAWVVDVDWGVLVWLAMVTGTRRGELCALRWEHLDLDAGVLAVRRSIWQRGRQAGEKDTKNHQQRRIALDPQTLSILTEHRRHCQIRAAEFSVELRDDAFMFSLAPDGSTHLLPDSVSQRYADLVARLGINSTFHELRHYSATELIASGVDARTVAGRLGHGGGGTTTLRYYTAWVSESDQRAASALTARMPSRPARGRTYRLSTHPYQQLAADLIEQIGAGTYPAGDFLPGQKMLAAEHGVSVGTANRAANLLAEDGYVEVVPGRGFLVLQRAAALPDEDEWTMPPDVEPDVRTKPAASSDVLFDFALRYRGQVVAQFSTAADPQDADDLRQVLVDAIVRRGGDDAEIGLYEMDVRRPGDGELIRMFVATCDRAAR
jgi:integrase/DNA-binding transcriptional regulator YhcF (GntR family)